MNHLTKHERNEIQILYEKNYSMRSIAKVLQRSPSTISRELRRNRVKWEYVATKANQKSYQRRRSRLQDVKKIRMNEKLEQYIHEKLKEKRSPELIAGRWNKMYKEWEVDEKISFKTIYRYVYGKFWTDLGKYLYMKRYRLKKRSGKKKKKELIPYRVWIDVRPESITSKQSFGHYEADLFVWPQGTKSVVLTLTEKVSRLKLAYLLPNKRPSEVQKKLQQVISDYGVQSITFDNWVEFMYHYKLDIPTYFCHPYHSWEKWQVEYTNKLYRMYIPKWTNLSTIDQTNLDRVTKNLNNRPMKCLKYRTPSESYRSHLSKLLSVAIGVSM